MRTIVCVATGPSLRPAQLEVARRRGWPLYVCNDAIRWCPDAELLTACNWQWWDARWPEVRDLPCEKWTTRRESSARYGIRWIAERPCDGSGLSNDPDFLFHGHGSGYQLLGLAWRARPDRIVLLGYDLTFAPDYDARRRFAGSTPRHFFGEYEPELQHWPSVKVRGGVHVELLSYYRDVARQRPCEIVNCTGGGVLDCFPMDDIHAID